MLKNDFCGKKISRRHAGSKLSIGEEEEGKKEEKKEEKKKKYRYFAMPPIC